MKLHALAIHNHVVELYEKAETAIPGMHAVRLKLSEEVYAGVGTTFKLAKQDAATKALKVNCFSLFVFGYLGIIEILRSCRFDANRPRPNFTDFVHV